MVPETMACRWLDAKHQTFLKTRFTVLLDRAFYCPIAILCASTTTLSKTLATVVQMHMTLLKCSRPTGQSITEILFTEELGTIRAFLPEQGIPSKAHVGVLLAVTLTRPARQWRRMTTSHS